MIQKSFYLLIPVVAILLLYSCENVKEGYRPNYVETPAELNVEVQSYNRGAIGDTVYYNISGKSDYELRSLVVNTSISGAEGTRYRFDSSQTDPFIDHAFGTIQKGVTGLDISYTYIIAQDTVDASLSFILVDEYGKKTIKQTIHTVPSIVTYDSVLLYTKSASKTDGLSTVDGEVYQDLTNYEAATTANETVQETLDIIFLVQNDQAKLVSPYDGSFNSKMLIKNKTLFKKVTNISNDAFNALTNASLSTITAENEVASGKTFVENVKVGDIIGFRTDFASVNPYHYGLLRINAVHPVTADHYDGTSFVIEMDIATQK